MSPRYFRYSQQKYTDSLLSEGSLRIGTLEDFRNQEHKAGIADPMEGRKTVSHTTRHLMYGSDGKPRSPFKQDELAAEHFSALSGVKGRYIFFSNCTLKEPIQAPNVFVLCMSLDRSQETMDQFNGTDSCVEILWPSHFFRSITKALNQLHSVTFAGVLKVTYQAREEVWNGRDWGTHPAVIKSPDYEKQYEARAIWQPLGSESIEPVILTESRAGNYCELRTVDNL